MLKKAAIKDVKAIYNILNMYGEKGMLLSRPLSVLYENIRNFYIYEDKKTKKVIGCCSLQFSWEDLAEIRSLAVLPEFTRQKIGTTLAKAALNEAKQYGINKVFTLTYKLDFFDKLGFQVIEKTKLPLKIWSDCINCLKFPDCDETAMMLELNKSP
ncbi:MAG: N-acetyltransferase [Deltaproteobacteria bacterium]|nr:N-acetyltransferase [Deltaproteobacteria bacterium]